MKFHGRMRKHPAVADAGGKAGDYSGSEP